MADAYLDLLRQRLIELRSAHLARDDGRLLAVAREIGEQLLWSDLGFLDAADDAGVTQLRAKVEQVEDDAAREETARAHELDFLNAEVERLTKELAEARTE